MTKRSILAMSVLALVCQALPAAAQKSKDTVRIPLTLPIQGVSFYINPNLETDFIAEAIFDDLIVFNEKTYKFEPLLAKSWKQVDASTLEFQLREDVKWHDGQKFTADDVVSTLNWVIDPNSKLRNGSNWNFIGKVEKTGPYTVRVVSKEPTPYAITRLAYSTAMEAEHAQGKAADKVVYSAGKPVGTGMYKVTQIDSNKGIYLERNPDFNHGGIGKPASNIGKMELLYVPDDGTRLAKFMVRELDMLRDTNFSTAEDLAKTPGVTSSIGQGLVYMYMAIDAKGRSGVKPLTDLRVRKALMMAVNRKDILTFLTNGRDVRTPNAMCWEFQTGCDFTLKPYPFDVAGAKKLLAEAGYADGFPLEITTLLSESTKGTAQIVANQLNQIGIKATVAPNDVATYRKKLSDGKIQVFLGAWTGGGNADVQGTIQFLYAVPESRDYTGDQAMNEMAEKTLTIMDPDARKALGRQVFDRSTEMAYFTPVGPGPALVVHTTELSVDPGAFNAYSINPSNIRWK